MCFSNLLSLPSWLRDFLNDPFKKYLCLALILISIAIAWLGPNTEKVAENTDKTVHFFFQPNCSHCRQQKTFNLYLKTKYPELTFIEYDTSHPENAKLLANFLDKRALTANKIIVPMTFIGPYSVEGFISVETTGATLEKTILAYLHNGPTILTENAPTWQDQETVTLPFLGKIQPADYSLPALAVIIGLADGFNPCAMWVLVYLISLIVTLQDYSVIVLAFIVNSIEFACSAALPAIFTHTLTLRHLPTWHYYGYILLYDFFFMLDDMIIFGLAAWLWIPVQDTATPSTAN